ncbi:MAG: peptidase [Holophagaceae bacterium]|nr:peptidase [Holophagaceae bacterium]
MLVLAPVVLLGQNRVMPEVRGVRLSNGLEVLCVERPGTGVLHAGLFIKGGRSATGNLPPCAADLLGQSLFRRVSQADLQVDGGLETLLKEEEGLFEGLRLKGAPLVAETQGLAQAHERLMTTLRARTGAGDVLTELGAVQSQVRVEADYASWQADLPSAKLPSVMSALGSLLSQARLARLPEERERLLGLQDQESLAPSILLGAAALPGAYGRLAERTPGALESLRWSEMRAYAKRVLVPEGMTLVLVGDVSAGNLAPLLESSLGRLQKGSQVGRDEPWAAGITPWEGARQLKATVPRDRRVFVAWRVPPLSHPDAPALQLLCQMLASGNGSRLIKALKEEQGLAARVTVRMGVPGGRETNLFVVEADPAEGKGLEELEQAIRSEMYRLYAEPMRDGELQRAMRQAEGLAQGLQEDAGDLVQALGVAKVQTGDWRSAFPPIRLGAELRQETVQDVIRRYLAPTQSLTVTLEPDALSSPRDAMETQLVRILEQLAKRRTQDTSRVNAIIRDVLQQVRMLPPAERLKTLKLLESQVKP